MVHVADLGRDDVRRRRAGEKQELVELVRADVAEDAAVTLAGSKNQARTSRRVHPVRTESDGLDDVADRARLTSSPALTVARFSRRSL